MSALHIFYKATFLCLRHLISLLACKHIVSRPCCFAFESMGKYEDRVTDRTTDGAATEQNDL